jgi:hypothetical protein
MIADSTIKLMRRRKKDRKRDLLYFVFLFFVCFVFCFFIFLFVLCFVFLFFVCFVFCFFIFCVYCFLFFYFLFVFIIFLFINLTSIYTPVYFAQPVACLNVATFFFNQSNPTAFSDIMYISPSFNSISNLSPTGFEF